MNATPSDDRPGQRFQNFIATLERMFAHKDDVKVDSPLRLRDKDTKRLREHDVVITRTTHHGPNLTAIECKDHGRKIGVNDVEGFSKKCEKTGIHHGIMVSASRFTDTARVKAKAINITLMDLTQAESFEWIGQVTIIGQIHNYRWIDIHVNLVIPLQIAGPFTIHDPDGNEYRGDGAQSFLMREIPHEELPEPGVYKEGSMTAPADQFWIIDANGQRHDVTSITFNYGLEIERTEQPITLHNYLGEDAAMEIASGQIFFPGGSATLALVRHKDGEVSAAVHTKGATDHTVQIGDGPRRAPIIPQS